MDDNAKAALKEKIARALWKAQHTPSFGTYDENKPNGIARRITDRDAETALAVILPEIETLEKALRLSCETIEGCPMNGRVDSIWPGCDDGYPECGQILAERWERRAIEEAKKEVGA